MSADKVLRDIIVVGAGLSGLSAAILLQKSGLDVVVLEAQDRVGGRTLTEVVEDYGAIDLGGGNIPPNHHQLLNLAHEMGVASYLQKAKSEKIWFHNGTSLTFNDYYPRFWNPLVNLDFNNTIRELNRLMRQVSVSAPWDSSDAAYLDSISVKEWAIKHVWTRPVHGFVLFACRMNLTAPDPSYVSMLYFLWFLKQFSGLICFFPSKNPTRKEKLELKLHGGTQSVSINAAARLGNQHLHLGSPVTSIEQKDDHVIVTTEKGKEYIGKYVVMAISPSLYPRVSFTPPLPDDRLSNIESMQPSCLLKAILIYDAKFWKSSDFNKTLICADEDCPIICSGYYVVGERSMVSCICCVAVCGFGKLTAKERQDLLCQYLHKACGSEEALHPLKYIEKNWADEPYIRGCVAGSLPPGILTKYKHNFRKPYGRIYFAGSELAHKWVGQMGGAVIAGQKASKQILHNLGELPAGDASDDEEPQDMGGDILPHYYNNAFIRQAAPSVGGLVKLTLIGAGIAMLCGVCLYKGSDYV